MKKGYTVWAVICNEEPLAIFDNVASAENYIKRLSLKNAKIMPCQYL